jgi:uncharacterized paraquat-inducible protein A
MHTESAAQASSSFPHLLHDAHANCPNCGRPIASPIVDVHHDGSHAGYCASCRTEVFEADWSN